jgi:hypothetical protein
MWQILIIVNMKLWRGNSETDFFVGYHGASKTYATNKLIEDGFMQPL